LTTTKLTGWLKLWADHNKVEVNLSHKKSYESGRYYRLVSWGLGFQGGKTDDFSGNQSGKDDTAPF